MKKRKIVVVLGATASGKSKLAFELAKEFNGFLISADSRHVYKDLNIITGKDEGEWFMHDGELRYEVDGVPEYLVDFLEPAEEFSVYEYQKKVFEILDTKHLDKIPIIVGGTGLYVSSVVDNYLLEQGGIDKNIRGKLEERFEKEGLENLVKDLQEQDPEKADSIDLQNPRRVIRALESLQITGESFGSDIRMGEQKYDVLQIGIEWPRDVLYDRINRRIDLMLQNGGWHEVEHVLDMYSETLNAVSSIGYKQLGLALLPEGHQEKISKEEAIELFKRDSRRYAKRQLTWFKRDERIQWVKSGEYQEVENLVKEFLGK